jgi:prepilin-type N-terminal cleavage/methylation domain-containing protein
VGQRREGGFTLIELSIVLVIIGLIVGGVLAGQSLISAAAVRAQITQIEKYNTAANTFRGKYGHLPGDMSDPDATIFGFKPRGAYPGWGNDDGVIAGLCSNPGPGSCGYGIGAGEGTLFWVDLSTAHLIDGGFNTATPGIYPNSITSVSPYYPAAAIGRGNYVYIWSGGYYSSGAQYPGDSRSYFGVSAITSIGATSWEVNSSPALTVAEAYGIDAKIDDGLPQSGRVQAMYIDWTSAASLTAWAAGGGGTSHGVNNVGLPATYATPGSATTCYDNGNASGTQKYSLTQNNGAGVNCALSFRMQAGD